MKAKPSEFAAYLRPLPTPLWDMEILPKDDTPCHILADYMIECLRAFERASRAREDWYGHRHAPGEQSTVEAPVG